MGLPWKKGAKAKLSDEKKRKIQANPLSEIIDYEYAEDTISGEQNLMQGTVADNFTRKKNRNQAGETNKFEQNKPIATKQKKATEAKINFGKVKTVREEKRNAQSERIVQEATPTSSQEYASIPQKTKNKMPRKRSTSTKNDRSGGGKKTRGKSPKDLPKTKTSEKGKYSKNTKTAENKITSPIISAESSRKRNSRSINADSNSQTSIKNDSAITFTTDNKETKINSRNKTDLNESSVSGFLIHGDTNTEQLPAENRTPSPANKRNSSQRSRTPDTNACTIKTSKKNSKQPRKETLTPSAAKRRNSSQGNKTPAAKTRRTSKNNSKKTQVDTRTPSPTNGESSPEGNKTPLANTSKNNWKQSRVKTKAPSPTNSRNSSQGSRTAVVKTKRKGKNNSKQPRAEIEIPITPNRLNPPQRSRTPVVQKSPVSDFFFHEDTNTKQIPVGTRTPSPAYRKETQGRRTPIANSPTSKTSKKNSKQPRMEIQTPSAAKRRNSPQGSRTPAAKTSRSSKNNSKQSQVDSRAPSPTNRIHSLEESKIPVPEASRTSTNNSKQPRVENRNPSPANKRNSFQGNKTLTAKTFENETTDTSRRSYRSRSPIRLSPSRDVKDNSNPGTLEMPSGKSSKKEVKAISNPKCTEKFENEEKSECREKKNGTQLPRKGKKKDERKHVRKNAPKAPKKKKIEKKKPAKNRRIKKKAPKRRI